MRKKVAVTLRKYAQRLGLKNGQYRALKKAWVSMPRQYKAAKRNMFLQLAESELPPEPGEMSDIFKEIGRT